MVQLALDFIELVSLHGYRDQLSFFKIITFKIVRFVVQFHFLDTRIDHINTEIKYFFSDCHGIKNEQD